MPESPASPSAGLPRLIVDIERQLPEFRLAVRLQVGTEICVLFGPSGVGKTTTLNIIAGLLAPDAGEILLDGRPLFRRGRPGIACNVPARHRNIGYVFQGYALFPHLNALENVAYPLRGQRDARSRAVALLDRMHLAHLTDRYPAELSGGQQQRVAIARALAADPQVLLLDEPFSALDAGVREHLQRDLAALQAELRLAVIYVTHRLEDAFAMGHTLAVMGEGQVAQVGPIEEVFRRPVNAGVAEIMGVRNLFRAKVISAGPEGLMLNWAGLRLEAPPQAATAGAILTSYIRPEEIKVLYPDRPLTGAVARNQVSGRIVESRPSTSYRVLRVALENGHELEVRFPLHAYAGLQLSDGETVSLSLRREALVGLEMTPRGVRLRLRLRLSSRRKSKNLRGLADLEGLATGFAWRSVSVSASFLAWVLQRASHCLFSVCWPASVWVWPPAWRYPSSACAAALRRRLQLVPPTSS